MNATKTNRQRQLSALEAVINQSIRLDPLAKQRLDKLAGVRIRVQCLEPAVDVGVTVSSSEILLEQPNEEDNYTTELSGDLSAFAKLLSANDKAAALINSELRLKGDSQPLIELQETLTHIELDWEYHLANLLGDLPAHLVGKMGRTGFHWLKETQPVLMRHLQEFIQEEARLSPTDDELEQFISQVQLLDERIERLNAKINKLHTDDNQ